MTIESLWNYRPDVYGGDRSLDLIGFEVETPDGKVGVVEEESTVAGDSYVVVDAGPWIFERKLMIPAGVVTRIDPGDRKVYVSRTKEEIKASPEPDEAAGSLHRRLSDYYRGLPAS
ncbi:PRC-barrel domain containing protein [Planomonospora corallina]|uniref:PRC-barrel domain containing protein n=1 Tax=Planomonospora corallina TaxID=1806052 RepID=A0ABV8I843_9ACTN